MLARLIKLALTQRLMMIVATIVMVGLGVWAYRSLPIDAYPDISTTQVQVIVKAPGMSPLEVEQRVTRPLEVEVRGIPRQTVLRSLTKNALSVVTIDFEEGTDIYWARQQISERIGGVLATLPAGVEGGLAPVTSPLSEVYMFMVEGEGRSLRELRSVLDWIIRPRLLTVEGVADVNALGGHSRAFRVEPRPAELRDHDLTLDDLARAIRANNRNSGAGHMTRNDEVLLVRTEGQVRDAGDIALITVATRDGVPVRVRDVASVTVGHVTRYGGVTANGQGEGVQGLVLLRTGANGRETVERVKERLRQIEPNLPRGVQLVTIYDRGDLITRAVRTVSTALGQGVVVVLIVLALFLGNVRSAVTAGLILPLTVLGTFLLMRLFDISANLMSLGGMAIAVGILVDAAVVVVENIHTRLGEPRAGMNRLHVVYRAVREVARPVLSAGLIIVASFAPILALTGVEGKLFVPLALTIAFAVGTSLLLSLTVIPVISSFLMRGGRGAGPGRLLGRLLRLYRPVVDWALRRRGVAVALALAGLGAAVAVFPLIGREFLPTLDEGTVVIQTEKLPSISLERSMARDLEVQRALMQVPEVVGVYSRVGADELRLDPMGFHQTDSFLVTRPRGQWTVEDAGALQERLRRALRGFDWMSFGFTQPIDMRVSEMLTGVRAAVAVKLYGDDLELLEARSRQIQRIVRRTPGAVDVFRTPLGGQRYLQISPRRDLLARKGLDVEHVNRLLESAVGGVSVSEVVDGSRRTPIVLQLPPRFRESGDSIAALQLALPDGRGRVRLDQVAGIAEVEGPVQLERESGKRVVAVQANVKGRDVVGFVEELERRIRDQVKLPPGYYTEYGGQFENERRATRRLMLVGPAALFGVFLLLFSTFGSVRQAGLILLNVPFALTGGVLLLHATGLYLSVPASVGFIALLGVAIENGVVLVNHFNDLRRMGTPVEQAVRRGAARRLRPVLMTAILTMLGLVPLLAATGPGSEIQRPLAVVVVGGTFTSTVLTLVLLPTLYAWAERRHEARVSRLAAASAKQVPLEGPRPLTPRRGEAG
jgi:cobalt-zinc-cadmium resistance protein CzcA